MTTWRTRLLHAKNAVGVLRPAAPPTHVLQLLWRRDVFKIEYGDDGAFALFGGRDDNWRVVRRAHPPGQFAARTPVGMDVQGWVGARLRVYAGMLHHAVTRAVAKEGVRDRVPAAVLFVIAERSAFFGHAAHRGHGEGLLNAPPAGLQGDPLSRPTARELGALGAAARGGDTRDRLGVCIRSVNRSFNRAMVHGLSWDGMQARNRARMYWASFSQRGYWSDVALWQAVHLLDYEQPQSWAARFAHEADEVARACAAYMAHA